MTKKELIEKLTGYPDDTLVVVNGYEGGFDDINGIELLEVIDTTECCDWWGRYDLDCDNKPNAIPALVLR
jgi:hypothetical protein